MNVIEQIEYGFLDDNGNNICDSVDLEDTFNKVYYLMSPEELVNKKIGVCWDQVELERKLFEENNIKNETYFIYIDDKNNLPSHTFLVYYMDNKVYWFEHSWFDEKGIHEYNMSDEEFLEFINSGVLKEFGNYQYIGNTKQAIDSSRSYIVGSYSIEKGKTM